MSLLKVLEYLLHHSGYGLVECAFEQLPPLGLPEPTAPYLSPGAVPLEEASKWLRRINQEIDDSFSLNTPWLPPHVNVHRMNLSLRKFLDDLLIVVDHTTRHCKIKAVRTKHCTLARWPTPLLRDENGLNQVLVSQIFVCIASCESLSKFSRLCSM